MEFSKTWKRSKKPSKQRKYRAKAPLHIQNKFLGCHLSKELRTKHGKRTITLRKSDKVKVLVGQFKGKSGKIERVNMGKQRAYVTGIEFTKKDGGKGLYPLHPSNLMITELFLEDKKRLRTQK